MYEVVNQKLGIKACRIGDLGKELVFSFLNQWEEGAKIAVGGRSKNRRTHIVF